MNTSTHSATHEVWFACEFHGSNVPVFTPKTDVTYWEGVKFFHNKEDAIKHAHDLAVENVKACILGRKEYEKIFQDGSLDVDNFNRLVKEYNLAMPYLLVDKYEVKGTPGKEFECVSCFWYEGNESESVHSDFIAAFFKDSESFCKGFDYEKYAKEHTLGNAHCPSLCIGVFNIE